MLVCVGWCLMWWALDGIEWCGGLRFNVMVEAGASCGGCWMGMRMGVE